VKVKYKSEGIAHLVILLLVAAIAVIALFTVKSAVDKKDTGLREVPSTTDIEASTSPLPTLID
jgi:hypothetical protein